MSWNKQKKQDLADSEKVYPAALNYLIRRDYGVDELRTRLLQRGAEEDAVDETVERLLAAGYLDDKRFALSRVRQRRDFGPRGRSFIRRELRELKVADDIILEALEEEYSEELEEEILTDAVKNAAHFLPGEDEPEKRRKKLASLQRHFVNHGFPPGLVLSLLRRFAVENE